MINECLLVNYIVERGDDSAILTICRSCDNESAADIRTFHGEKAKLLYFELLGLINKEDFEE